MVLNEPLRNFSLQIFVITFASNFSEVLLFDLTECSMICNLKAKNYVEFPFTFCLPSLRSLGGNKNLYLDDSVYFPSDWIFDWSWMGLKME